jgi:hypothetical protein|tara:strand:+ start:580 stop:807 length:228 start_codon:yes stop_codon:yes gene_type:complete
MKIWEITSQDNNVVEDATPGATSSADVAGAAIAFPLFVSPKKARKAVDPFGHTTPKGKKKTKFQPYTQKVSSIFA